MDSRAQFEEAMKPSSLDLRGAINDWTGDFHYTHSHIDALWRGWQARERTLRPLVEKMREALENGIKSQCYCDAELRYYVANTPRLTCGEALRHYPVYGFWPWRQLKNV